MRTIKTIENLEEKVSETLLMADKGVIRALVASVIANRMDLDPVWLLLVTGSSGGKTELINSLLDLKFMHPISDLTTNTFASGMNKPGKETSLLFRMDNGIMAFKDFTSILSKNKDERKAIMGQLREIYEGQYNKKVGTGDDIDWTGKLGAIAGCTESIYQYMSEMSAMGDRFVMYNILQPERLAASEKAFLNSFDIKERRTGLRKAFAEYISMVIEFIHENEMARLELGDKIRKDVLSVADFATLARSAVIESFKSGLPEFVPSPEMPMRMASQLYSLAAALTAMKCAEGQKDVTLKKEDLSILYKIAFDSIPRTRRDVLIPLAKYKGGITTAGIAIHLNLPSQSIKRFLAQLNALGICERIKNNGPQGDNWKLKECYRDIILKYDDSEVINTSLQATRDDVSNMSLEDPDEWLRSDKFDPTKAGFEQI